MSTIRVLITDAPTMLREILEQVISNEPDMELMTAPQDPIEAANDRPMSPDVVIVGANVSEAAGRARVLLNRWPECHVLMITAGGQKVLKYELLPRGVDLGEMSPGQVVETIRLSTRREGEPHVH